MGGGEREVGSGCAIRFIYFQFTELKVFARVNTCVKKIMLRKKYPLMGSHRSSRKKKDL